jgi:hypothetical protein
MVCQCEPHLPSAASTNSYLQISSSASPPKPPNSPHTTRNPQSHLERSRPPSDSSCQVNLPSMPSQKAQRPSPSTPAQANRRGKCGFLSSSVLARALGCELGRSHMGVVGLFINDALWDGSNAQLSQICFYGLAFQRKVNRMYNIHQQAMSQRNASIPVS